MVKVLVLTKGLTSAEVAAARQLAVTAGCDPVNVVVIDGVGGPETLGLDEIVLVVLTDANQTAGMLDEDLGKAPAGGRRVVCVWPEGATARVIPDAVGKFSYSIISWDHARLRAVLFGEDETIFEDASGQPLQLPNQDHLECE